MQQIRSRYFEERKRTFLPQKKPHVHTSIDTDIETYPVPSASLNVLQVRLEKVKKNIFRLVSHIVPSHRASLHCLVARISISTARCDRAL